MDSAKPELSIFAKVRAVSIVLEFSLPGNTIGNRRRRSRRLIHLSLASPGRTPEWFTVNSRGWREARAPPLDCRRSAPEPRRGSPATKPSDSSRDGTTPPGWQASGLPFPGVGSGLAHPRTIQRQPLRGCAGESPHRLSQRLICSRGVRSAAFTERVKS